MHRDEEDYQAATRCARQEGRAQEVGCGRGGRRRAPAHYRARAGRAALHPRGGSFLPPLHTPTVDSKRHHLSSYVAVSVEESTDEWKGWCLHVKRSSACAGVEDECPERARSCVAPCRTTARGVPRRAHPHARHHHRWSLIAQCLLPDVACIALRACNVLYASCQPPDDDGELAQVQAPRSCLRPRPFRRRSR